MPTQKKKKKKKNFFKVPSPCLDRESYVINRSGRQQDKAASISPGRNWESSMTAPRDAWTWSDQSWLHSYLFTPYRTFNVVNESFPLGRAASTVPTRERSLKRTRYMHVCSRRSADPLRLVLMKSEPWHETHENNGLNLCWPSRVDRLINKNPAVTHGL